MNPAAAAYSLAQLPARMAALLKPADRERLAARVRELDELAELMRQPGGLAEAPASARCTAQAKGRTGDQTANITRRLSEDRP